MFVTSTLERTLDELLRRSPKEYGEDAASKTEPAMEGSESVVISGTITATDSSTSGEVWA